MEDNTNQNMGHNNCAMCASHGGFNDRWMCGHHHFLALRIILGLVILAIVFCVGFKMGEFKGIYGDYYGANMMGNREYRIMTTQPMMFNNQGYQVQGQAVPTIPKK
jgi:hypothetical protein